MNNNLGPDKAWNDAVWQGIDKAVLAEVGQIRASVGCTPRTKRLQRELRGKRRHAHE